MNDPKQSLAKTLAQAWERLGAATVGAIGPSRLIVLATLSDKGPETRILVLRQVDVPTQTLTLYTDAATPKVAELTADPRCAVQFWDAEAQLQLRLRCIARTSRGDPRLWAKMPEGAQEVYGVTPTPGTPIAAADAYDRNPDPDKFLKLSLTVTEIDLTDLSQTPHRRAAFHRADGWVGQWLAP